MINFLNDGVPDGVWMDVLPNFCSNVREVGVGGKLWVVVSEGGWLW